MLVLPWTSVQARLSSWEEVDAHLARVHAGVSRGAGRSVVSLSTAAGPQTIEVTARDGWLDLLGEVASARYLPLVRALAISLRGPNGVLGIREGIVVVRQILPLVGITVAALDETILSLANQSALGRRVMMG